MDNSPPEFVGEQGIINKSEFIRLILQSLYSLGFSRAASTLEFESGIHLDLPEYSSLLSQTLAGQWESSVATIQSISDLDLESKSIAQFLIWKEHFLELLGSKGEWLSAKDVLLRRISTLDLDRKRVHGLARSLIDMKGVVKAEERAKRRMGLLLELLGLMPEWFRVPSGRLEKLVEMAVCRQVDSCFYHNSEEYVSLYEDHECSLEHLPCKCSQTLADHKNEVWFVQFSASGKYLASSSSDCTAIIWTIHITRTFRRLLIPTLLQRTRRILIHRMTNLRRSGRLAGSSSSGGRHTTPPEDHAEAGDRHEDRSDAMLALMQGML